MDLIAVLRNLDRHRGTVRDATRVANAAVLRSLLGPAWRGFVRQAPRGRESTALPVAHEVRFDWTYERDRPDLARLYTAAKRSQWDAETALDWSTAVDPADPARDLMPEEHLPYADLPTHRAAGPRERVRLKRDWVAWMLSQFLHGEQGALFAAAQLTTAVEWIDGKFYGSTQVVDEGRHLEAFHRYLTEKLGRRYEINENLYVIIDALMSDSRWDVKFLGMQILIEGLALGAFGMIRRQTREPLLRELLRYVITDEARHVHFGVLALERLYGKELSDRELRDRQDWAFEMALLLRNRFLVHEFHEEHFAHALTRAAWEKHLVESRVMRDFRHSMFRRTVPNLGRLRLIPDRLRPHYEEIGLLAYEHLPAAPDLAVGDLLAD
jgi:hypothetical protein